jgi:hypothetical protein
MSTLKTRRASQKPQAESGKPLRPDPYEQVTSLIIEHLEKGVVPWRCPWNREIGRPRIFATGKAYRGVNTILLGCRYAASPWWMTYRQATERGGHVRKGERGAMAVKYGTFDPKDAASPISESHRRKPSCSRCPRRSELKNSIKLTNPPKGVIGLSVVRSCSWRASNNGCITRGIVWCVVIGCFLVQYQATCVPRTKRSF